MLGAGEREASGEDGVDERLALDRLVGEGVDPQDELEANDRLADRRPDRGIDVPPGSTAEVAPVEEPAHVGLEVSEGVGFVEPAEDELRGARGTLRVSPDAARWSQAGLAEETTVEATGRVRVLARLVGSFEGVEARPDLADLEEVHRRHGGSGRPSRGRTADRRRVGGRRLGPMEEARVGGRFVTLEGPDGAGKSSQSRRLASALEGSGHDVLLTASRAEPRSARASGRSSWAARSGTPPEATRCSSVIGTWRSSAGDRWATSTTAGRRSSTTWRPGIANCPTRTSSTQRTIRERPRALWRRS